MHIALNNWNFRIFSMKKNFIFGNFIHKLKFFNWKSKKKNCEQLQIIIAFLVHRKKILEYLICSNNRTTKLCETSSNVSKNSKITHKESKRTNETHVQCCYSSVTVVYYVGGFFFFRFSLFCTDWCLRNNSLAGKNFLVGTINFFFSAESYFVDFDDDDRSIVTESVKSWFMRNFVPL